MMRKTYTILAVALTASACGGVASEAPSREPTKQELAQELSKTPIEDALKNKEHFAPLCDGHGYPLPGNVNAKGGAPDPKVSQLCAAIGTKPDPKPAPQPAPLPSPAACDRDALNQELSSSYPLPEALMHAQHFRCLCDDKGYPLVGNINSKGTTASAFCGALREKGLL